MADPAGWNPADPNFDPNVWAAQHGQGITLGPNGLVPENALGATPDRGQRAGLAVPAVAPAAPAPVPNSGPNLVSLARMAARSAGVPEEMFLHQIAGESNFNPAAQNSVGPGHFGLGQFDPQTAAAYNVNPSDPVSSLFGAARYMADLQAKTGDWASAMRVYLGASTPGGLARVLAANPNYAAAYSMASGGPEIKYAGAPTGWKSGLSSRLGPGAAALDLSPLSSLADSLAAPRGNQLQPGSKPGGGSAPTSVPAQPSLNSSLALIGLLVSGIKAIPVSYDPFASLPAAGGGTDFAMRAPVLAASGATRPTASLTTVAPYVTRTGMRAAYQQANPGFQG